MERNETFDKDKLHSIVIEAKYKFKHIRENNGIVNANEYIELCILEYYDRIINKDLY